MLRRCALHTPCMPASPPQWRVSADDGLPKRLDIPTTPAAASELKNRTVGNLRAVLRHVSTLPRFQVCQRRAMAHWKAGGGGGKEADMRMRPPTAAAAIPPQVLPPPPQLRGGADFAFISLHASTWWPIMREYFCTSLSGFSPGRGDGFRLPPCPQPLRPA